MSLGIFFIKQKHEVRTAKLTSQSGSQLFYWIYIPSVTSVFLSQYSQASHEISLLSGTIRIVYTYRYSACVPLLYLVNQGSFGEFMTECPHLSSPMVSVLQKLFVGKILVFQNSFIPTWSISDRKEWLHNPSPSHPQFRQLRKKLQGKHFHVST